MGGELCAKKLDDVRNVSEFCSDEHLDTACRADPPSPFARAYFIDPMGNPGQGPLETGKRGDPVWFVIALEDSAEISTICFRHDLFSATSGWFDPAGGKPYAEIAEQPISTKYAAIPAFAKSRWRRVGTFQGYPEVGDAAARIGSGERYELRLPSAVRVYGIRLAGRPVGEYASCAVLGAYS